LSPITAVRPRGDDGTAMPNAGRGTETWLRSKHRDSWGRSTERWRHYPSPAFQDPAQFGVQASKIN